MANPVIQQIEVDGVLYDLNVVPANARGGSAARAISQKAATENFDSIFDAFECPKEINMLDPFNSENGYYTSTDGVLTPVAGTGKHMRTVVPLDVAGFSKIYFTSEGISDAGIYIGVLQLDAEGKVLSAKTFQTGLVIASSHTFDLLAATTSIHVYFAGVLEGYSFENLCVSTLASSTYTSYGQPKTLGRLKDEHAPAALSDLIVLRNDVGTITERVISNVPEGYISDVTVGGYTGEVGFVLTPTGATAYNYVKVSVNAGERYTAKLGMSNSDKYKNYIFQLDKDDKVVALNAPSTSIAQIVTQEVTIEASVESLLVMNYTGKIDGQYILEPSVKKITTIDLQTQIHQLKNGPELSSLRADIGVIDDFVFEDALELVADQNLFSGGFICEVGEPIEYTSTTAYHYAKIRVYAGEQYRVTTRLSTSTKYGHFVAQIDSAGIVLAVHMAAIYDYDTRTDFIDIVEGASYMLVLNAFSSMFPLPSILPRKPVSLQEQVNVLKGLVGSGVSEIGKRLLDQSRNTVMKRNEEQKFINFAWITDCHINGVHHPGDVDATNNLKLFKALCDERWLDFAVLGGDMFTSGGNTRAETFALTDDAMHLVGGTQLPLFVTKGNHDVNCKCLYIANTSNESSLDWVNVNYYVLTDYKTYTKVSKAEWEALEKPRLYYGNSETDFDLLQVITSVQWQLLYQQNIGMSVTRNELEPDGGYFYADFAREKVRIIVTNVFTEKSEIGGWLNTQTRWIAEKALDLSGKLDWSVLLIAHAFPVDSLNAYSGKKSVKLQLYDVLSAFVSGSAITPDPDRATDGAIKNFNISYAERGAGNLVCFLHGHDHADVLNTSHGYNIIGTNAGYGSGLQLGTKDEFSFDIFTIDTANKILYDTRIGRGANRSFPF